MGRDRREYNNSDYGYQTENSPRGMDDKRYRQLVQEVSKGINYLDQLTMSIEQKSERIGTRNDSRNNHSELMSEIEKGNKAVGKVRRRVKELRDGVKRGESSKSKNTQYKKLASDFRKAMERFERVAEDVVEMEQTAVDQIRRSSVAQPKQQIDYKNYSEEQLYSNAQITSYDEDDLARREEDIINIGHAIKQVNGVYRQLDGLVQDQDEVIVEIAENAQDAKDNAEGALDNVRKADEKTKYINCGKKKCCCILLVLIVVGILAASLASS